MYFKKELNSLNSLIKIVMKINNKYYRLALKKYCSNLIIKPNFIEDMLVIAIKGQKLINNITIVIKLY